MIFKFCFMTENAQSNMGPQSKDEPANGKSPDLGVNTNFDKMEIVSNPAFSLRKD